MFAECLEHLEQCVTQRSLPKNICAMNEEAWSKPGTQYALYVLAIVVSLGYYKNNTIDWVA